MSTNNPSNPFSRMAEQGQEAMSGAVRTWAEAVRRLSGQPGGSTPDVSALVDDAFDFAERVLAMQREFTKSMLRAYASTAAKVPDAAASTLNGAAEPGGKT